MVFIGGHVRFDDFARLVDDIVPAGAGIHLSLINCSFLYLLLGKILAFLERDKFAIFRFLFCLIKLTTGCNVNVAFLCIKPFLKRRLILELLTPWCAFDALGAVCLQWLIVF